MGELPVRAPGAPGGSPISHSRGGSLSPVGNDQFDPPNPSDPPSLAWPTQPNREPILRIWWYPERLFTNGIRRTQPFSSISCRRLVVRRLKLLHNDSSLDQTRDADHAATPHAARPTSSSTGLLGHPSSRSACRRVQPALGDRFESAAPGRRGSRAAIPAGPAQSLVSGVRRERCAYAIP